MFLEKLRAGHPGRRPARFAKIHAQHSLVVLGNPQQIDKNIFIGQAGS